MARLLIVEDDVITALALQHAVTRMGHQVVARTTSAADAMAAVQAYRPDAVLLDIRLVGPHNGVLVGTDIQALWSTPVIYLSGVDRGGILLDLPLLLSSPYAGASDLCQNSGRGRCGSPAAPSPAP